jgi:hypothetical protein
MVVGHRTMTSAVSQPLHAAPRLQGGSGRDPPKVLPLRESDGVRATRACLTNNHRAGMYVLVPIALPF